MESTIATLRRLLRQYTRSGFVKELIRDRFERAMEEFNHQYRMLREQPGYMAALGAYGSELALEFDTALHDAATFLRQEHFSRSLVCCEAANRAYESGKTAFASHAQLHEARMTLNALKRKLRVPARSMRRFENLLSDAETYFRERKFTQAKVFAAYCKWEMSALLAPDAPDPKACLPARMRISQCRTVYKRMQENHRVEDDMDFLKRALASVERLLSKQEAALAALLLDEIEDRTAAARVYFTELEKFQSFFPEIGPAAGEAAAEVNADESWLRATERLMMRRLQILSMKINGDGSGPALARNEPEKASA